MEERCRKTLFYQIFVGTLYTITVIEENNSTLVAQATEQKCQALQFILYRTFHLIYMHTIRNLIFIHTVIYLFYPAHVYEMRNFLCLGSRKQEMSTQARQRLDQSVHFVLKTHLQTLVKLINNQVFDVIWRKISLIQMIIETTWSSKYNLRTNLFHHAMLIHRSTTAIASHRTQTAAHILQYVSRLQSEFPTRSYHHRLCLVISSIYKLGKRQKISQCLATTCWRKYHHILVPVQDCLHGILLHIIELNAQFI